MSSTSTSATLARQNQILKVLSNRMGEAKSTSAVAEALASAGFKVTKRTVERDLAKLEEARLVKVKTRGRQRLWLIGRISSLHKATPDLEMALAVSMTSTLAERLLPDHIREALEPIFAELKSQLAQRPGSSMDWMSKISCRTSGVVTSTPNLNEPVMRAIREALATGGCLKLDYQKPGEADPRQHTVLPLGLICHWNKFYLHAQSARHTRPASFALHRIAHAEATTATIQAPEHFDIKKVPGFGSKGPIRLVLRLSPMLASRLDEFRLDPQQKISQPAGGDDWFRLQATVDHDWALEWLMLSKLEDVEVLQPKALRDKLAEVIRQGAERYGVAK